MFIELKSPKVCATCQTIHKAIATTSTKQWPVYGSLMRFDYQCFCGSNLMLVEGTHLTEKDTSILIARIVERGNKIILADQYGSDV